MRAWLLATLGVALLLLGSLGDGLAHNARVAATILGWLVVALVWGGLLAGLGWLARGRLASLRVGRGTALAHPPASRLVRYGRPAGSLPSGPAR